MESSIKYVFIVPNPMVLLNATEALHHYGLSHSECLLLLPLQTNLLERFIRVIRILDTQIWPNVKMLPFDAESSISKTLLTLKLRKIARSCGQLEKVFFFSTYRQYCRVFLGNCRTKERVLIDDGISTLMICRERNKDELPKPSFLSGMVSKITGGVPLDDRSPITVFTGLDVCSSKEDVIIKNHYGFLRSNIKESRQEENDDVYFYGQPLAECNYVEFSTYCNWVQIIRAEFGENRFKYIPHPIETNEHLSYLSKELGVEIMKFDLPPELYFASLATHRPRVLVSFVSSMLFNCSQVYGDTFEYVSIELDTKLFNCSESIRKHFKGTYDSLLANPGISVLDLLEVHSGKGTSSR